MDELYIKTWNDCLLYGNALGIKEIITNVLTRFVEICVKYHVVSHRGQARFRAMHASDQSLSSGNFMARAQA